MEKILLGLLMLGSFSVFAGDLPKIKSFQMEKALNVLSGQGVLHFQRGVLVSGYTETESTCEVRFESSEEDRSIYSVNKLNVTNIEEHSYDSVRYVKLKIEQNKAGIEMIYCENYNGIEGLEKALSAILSIEK